MRRVRVAKRWLALLALMALSPLLPTIVPGCAYFLRTPIRPIRALEYPMEADARQDCLLVFMPGVLDGPETYEERGLDRDVRASGVACDVLAIDSHAGYFGFRGDVGRIDDVVYEDVLVKATLRGYREIWLVGVSLGGLGALVTAEKYPGYVDGLLLLAPVLGSSDILDEIREAGSIESWDPGILSSSAEWTPAQSTRDLWRWLKARAREPETPPAIFLGYGEEDSLARDCALLAESLPSENVRAAPGEHRWTTWKPLLRQLLVEAAPGRN